MSETPDAVNIADQAVPEGTLAASGVAGPARDVDDDLDAEIADQELTRLADDALDDEGDEPVEAWQAYADRLVEDPNLAHGAE